MKVAVIGRGKTGSQVINLLSNDEISDIYHSQNFPDAKRLVKADVAIVFVPGIQFDSIFQELKKAEIPVVCGVTGFKWPNNWDQFLKKPWILSNNFSFSMRTILKCLRELNNLSEQESYSISLTEKHHVNKKDSPSGTTLSWMSCFNKKVDVISEREGDIIGSHKVTLSSNMEEIELSHQALDRALFASGAIKLARFLLDNIDIEPRSYNFMDCDLNF